MYEQYKTKKKRDRVNEQKKHNPQVKQRQLVVKD